MSFDEGNSVITRSMSCLYVLSVVAAQCISSRKRSPDEVSRVAAPNAVEIESLREVTILRMTELPIHTLVSFPRDMSSSFGVSTGARKRASGMHSSLPLRHLLMKT